MVRLLLGVIAAAIVGLAVWFAVPSTPPLAAPSLGSATAPSPPQREAARPPAPPAPAPAVAPADDLDAALADCLGAQQKVAAARATRGGPAPAGEPSDAAVVSHGCAALYKQPACRDAMMHFDDPPPERRSAAVLQACARAYCGLLGAPKPSVCGNPDSVPQDEQQYIAWNELRQAILTHDIGPAAAQRALNPPARPR
jgi:hypothetical protein